MTIVNLDTMPKVYRAMLPDGGIPMVGSSAQHLGVRVPIDIRPDAGGFVDPGSGGMSVAPQLRDLPPHRIPRRLRSLPGLASAMGNNALRVWSMGDSAFTDSPVTSEFVLRIDPTDSRHGFIEPRFRMLLQHYSQALAATQTYWVIDEA